MKLTGSLTFALAATLLLAAQVFAAEKPAKAPAKPAKAAAAAAAASAPVAPAPAEPAPAAPKPSNLPETVAVVEGVEVKKQELENAFAMGLAQQNITADTISDAERPQIYRMILESLIAQKLVAKRAAGTKVSDAEVDGMMTDLQKKFGSEEVMKSMMQQRGLTPEKLKQDMRGNLQEQHWLDEQIKGKGEVTESDAEAFYKKNPDKFERPEQVRASHILISVPADAKPEVVVEKQKAAQAIAERVKKGEPFDKLASELSEDPSAKQNAGDLDYFTRERMVPEFSEVAFKMNKDEISEPVRSQFGYHVIKVTDRKPGGTVTLEEAKPKLVAFLKQQKRQEEIEKVIRGIREKADVKVNLPEPAATPTAATPAVPKAP